MKFGYLIFALFSSVLAIDHDDLIELEMGFIHGLEFNEDPYSLISCINDDLIPYWDEFYNYVNKTNDWTDNGKFITGLSLFMDASMRSLSEMILCSDKELLDIEEKIEIQAKNLKEMYEKILKQKADLVRNFTDIMQSWDKPEQAGEFAGKTIKLHFLI